MENHVDPQTNMCWYSCDHIVKIVQNSDTLYACSGSACEWIPDPLHSIPPPGSLSELVRFEGGSDDMKLIVRACPTDVPLHSSPVIQLASPWPQYPFDPGTPLAVCALALSCIRMKSGPTTAGKGLTIGWRTSSRYLTDVWAPVNDLQIRRVIQRNAFPNLFIPTSVSVIFHDVALGVTLSRHSPHPYMSVTHIQMKARLIWHNCQS